MDTSRLVDPGAALPARMRIGRGGLDGFPTLADVIGDDGALDDWLDRDSAGVGAPAGQVAASMLLQHVAMVLGGATLAEALLLGSLPCASPNQIRVAPGSGTRWEFSLDSPKACVGGDEDLLVAWVDHWVDGVFMDVAHALRRRVRVGLRLLRDNVASAAASSLVFLDWWAPDREFTMLAAVLTDAGSPPLGESIAFSRIEHGGRSGLQSTRRSCCLHPRCDPPLHCPSCPKSEPAEREHSMRTHLGHLDTVRAGGRPGPVPANTRPEGINR